MTTTWGTGTHNLMPIKIQVMLKQAETELNNRNNYFSVSLSCLSQVAIPRQSLISVIL